MKINKESLYLNVSKMKYEWFDSICFLISIIYYYLNQLYSEIILYPFLLFILIICKYNYDLDQSKSQQDGIHFSLSKSDYIFDTKHQTLPYILSKNLK